MPCLWERFGQFVFIDLPQAIFYALSGNREQFLISLTRLLTVYTDLHVVVKQFV